MAIHLLSALGGSGSELRGVAELSASVLVGAGLGVELPTANPLGLMILSAWLPTARND